MKLATLILLNIYPCLDKAHGANRIFRINSTNHVKLVYDVVQTNWIYISSKEREREREREGEGGGGETKKERIWKEI